MAKVSFTNAHNYHWRYSDFGRTEIESVSKNKIELRYTDDFDPERSPLTAVFKIKGGETYTPGQGENAGRNLLLSGKIANAKFFGEDGELQVKMSKLGLDAGVFHQMLLDEPYRAYETLLAEDSTFIGNSGEESGVDITTGSGDDVVQIKKGGSYVKDKGGSDTYQGSDESYDILTYDFWTNSNIQYQKGIVADYGRSEVVGPDGFVDTISSIDELRGTIFDDEMVGDGSEFENRFFGLRGNDFLDGGGGFDMARYDRDSDFGGQDGVEVNLAKGRARDGFGTVDQLVSIEGAAGTDQDDVFRDSRGDNFLEGNDGNDTFFMKIGDDGVDGGEGADQFIFLSKKFGFDHINDFDGAEGDTIEIRSAKGLEDIDIQVGAVDTIIVLNNRAEVKIIDYTDDITEYLIF